MNKNLGSNLFCSLQSYYKEIIMRHRLRKADRVKMAGKKNTLAQFIRGKAKKKWAEFRKKKGIK